MALAEKDKDSETLLADGLGELGENLMEQEKDKEAQQPLARAVALLEKQGRGAEAGAMRYQLGRAFYRSQAYPRAETEFRLALAVQEKASGKDDPNVASTLNLLARSLDHQKKFAEAEQLHKRALAIDEKALGPEDLAVAADLRYLADHYRDRDNSAEAEALYKRAIVIAEKAGDGGRILTTALQNYAKLLRQLSRAPEAEILEARAKEITGKKE